MQHTRRLTSVQHTKYYLRASYNRAACEDGSRAVHKIELTCSTRKITLVSHASSVRVTRQKYRNTHLLPHTSVNLEMSYTVCTLLHMMIKVMKDQQMQHAPPKLPSQLSITQAFEKCTPLVKHHCDGRNSLKVFVIILLMM